MHVDVETVAKLVAPLLVALIGAISKKYAEARPRLISYLLHASAFTLPEGNGPQVHTHSIVVRNAGKRTAHNVRIGHAFLPPSYQIYPPVNHKVLASPGGSAEIFIPTLVPNEQVSVAYLYYPPIVWNQINIYTKSDEGMASYINSIPSPQPPRWLTNLLWFFVFLGGSTALYWSFLAITRWIP